MNGSSKQYIEDEEFGLKQAKDEKKSFKSKWIKTSGTLRLIEFLEYYCEKKKEFINKLKSFKSKK